MLMMMSFAMICDHFENVFLMLMMMILMLM